MPEIELTQQEADALIALEKRRIDDRTWDYPGTGGSITVPLISTDEREEFLLDIRRNRIDLLKGTYQTRARHVIVLVRLDFGARPHRNPDGEEIGSPHLHVFREQFGDKWAFAPPPDRFQDLNDPWRVLSDFMNYCAIVDQPDIRKGLFS
jgi:hypothetical protein